MSSTAALLGSAPDSWGVWFPDDPGQTPWERFLDEVAAAGYRRIELGGRDRGCPTDLGRVAGICAPEPARRHPCERGTRSRRDRSGRGLVVLGHGHIAYCGGDNLRLIQDYPDRIGYVHLKQVDPAVVKQVHDAGIGFGEAVRMGAMCEPPLGIPEMTPILNALAALEQAELFAIVEQDMYPCPPDQPLPIATRTLDYLQGCGPLR